MAATQPTVRTAAKARPRRQIKVVPITLAILAVGGLGWFAWSKTHPAEDSASQMIKATVTKGDLTESITATGSITAQTGAMVKIGSQITGRIKRLYADVGSTVKAGQVIAELDLPDIQAQLAQAEANATSARTKIMQQQSGVGMEQTQISSAISQAQSGLRSAQARLASAQAALKQQTAQTPTEIRRAQNVVASAKAALSTAKSNLAQVNASANLQIANAQEQANQAQANANNSALNLKRQTDLYKQGFVAASTVDDAKAANAVNQSLVQSAQQNIQLVKEKVAADKQSASDLVAQAQQNVESAQSALVAAQAGTNQNTVKQADVNDARAQVRLAEAALRTAQGNTSQNVLKQQDIQQAQSAAKAADAQVSFYRAQLDKTFIRSPISGTVLQLAAQQGETLAAGLSAPTLIVVADLNRLQVDVYVDETDIGKVRKGQEADVTVDAFPKRIFKGKVMKVASGSTIQQGVVTYDVTVAIEDKQHRLKPDMTASVTIQTGKRTGVILVPSEGVKLAKRGATVNVLVTKDGKTSQETRSIKTGSTDGINTEVREGLKEGEIVILAGGDTPKRPGGGGAANPFGPAGGGAGGGGRGGGGGGGGGRGR